MHETIKNWRWWVLLPLAALYFLVMFLLWTMAILGVIAAEAWDSLYRLPLGKRLLRWVREGGA